VRIYDKFWDGSLRHKLVEVAGFEEFTGMHTVDLPHNVYIPLEDSFYVYVMLSKGGHPYDRTSDVPVLLGAEGKTIVTSSALPGESFYGCCGGEWNDLYYYDDGQWTGTLNFCMKALAVTDDGSLGANFSIENQVGEAPFEAEFFDFSTGNITSYEWHFGDGNTSTEENPVHVYADSGSFTVTLIVSGTAGSDTVTKENFVSVLAPLPPVAAFDAVPKSGDAPLEVTFINQSLGYYTACLWDFGDGETDTANAPVHTYTEAGTYSVTLTVTGPGGQSMDYQAALITVNEPVGVTDRSGIPSDFDLMQNYPNPFNPSTTIYYALPEAGRVSLIVYDLLGKKVAELVNEHQQEGYYALAFNAEGLNSGMYFYRIEAGDFSATKKMILLK
jgi:PKD repeat protein